MVTYILSARSEIVSNGRDDYATRAPSLGRAGADGRGKRIEIDRVAVKSSNLVSVGYDDASCILEIEFHGGRVYRYSGVPPEEHRGLMAAASHGKYFAANIKNRYAYTRVS